MLKRSKRSERHHDPADPTHEHATAPGTDAAAREKFGGVNPGACFFGWLVAIATGVLLSGVVGAVAAAFGSTLGLTRDDVEGEAGTIGLAAAIVLAVVVAIAYYAGGYVAGRMSRFDGARQGAFVWLIGLVVAVIAGVLGWLFGAEYNVLDRVDVPSLPISTDALSLGGIITALVVLVLALLAAMAGGKVGNRYHHRVDRIARPLP